MKKLLCTALLAFCVSSTPFTVERVHASGFPVVDIAHIAQSIIGYIQELSAYVEDLQQTALQGNQLAQLYTDYTQTLQEYEHYLDQIRAIRDVISAEEWENMVTQIEKEVEEISSFSVIVDLDPASGSFEEDQRTVLIDEGIAPAPVDDIMSLYTDELGVTGAGAEYLRQQLEAIDLQYKRYAAQQESAAIQNDAMNKFNEQLIEQPIALDSLGEQSDLATLQFIAAQQIMQMNQMKLMMEQNNKAMQFYEPASINEVRSKSRARETEAQRLLNNRNTPAQVGGVTNYADCFANGDCSE